MPAISRAREMAYHFLVRRYGKSVNWNCTCLEIAQETSVPINRVRAICARKGYLRSKDPSPPATIMPVDSFIALRNPFIRNMY